MVLQTAPKFLQVSHKVAVKCKLGKYIYMIWNSLIGSINP